MKRTLSLALLALLASCSQTAPVAAPQITASAPQPQHTASPTPRYIALPGQAAVAVNSDVDAAFDQQVAAYAGQSTVAQAATTSAAPDIDITETPAAVPAPAPAPNPVADITSAVTNAASAAGEALNNAVSDVTAAVTAPAEDITAPTGGNMNYKVRITNDTPGRIFVEAQDAAGTIYPCGFMENGRTFTTPMENAAPIKGPITVVVRDPDQPGAPEIRRYKVDPPTTDYNGKAVEVNILKGGRYMAGVNGQVYYSTPAAEEPAPAPTPAP